MTTRGLPGNQIYSPGRYAHLCISYQHVHKVINMCITLCITYAHVHNIVHNFAIIDQIESCMTGNRKVKTPPKLGGYFDQKPPRDAIMHDMIAS